MPELPEVEVIRRGLAPYLQGRSIRAARWSGKKLRQPMPRKLLSRYIVGSTVRKVARRAKYLLIYMENESVLVFHLGMTGRLGLFETTRPPAQHDHLRLELDGGDEVRFNDTRRFGFVLVIEPGQKVENILPSLGPEPFAGSFTGPYLHQQARRRRQPVKAFLMDNRVVVGVGNIYASEILHAAGISPASPVQKLEAAAWEKIAACTRMVLQQAIEQGGTTIADFVNFSGRSGYFQNQLMVYGRQGRACRRCQGLIVRTTHSGRATFFCPDCQK